MWSVILTLTVCFFLACLTSAMLIFFLCGGYYVNNPDKQNKIAGTMLILNYIILISLVFSGVVSLGVLTLSVVGLFIVVNIIYKEK